MTLVSVIGAVAAFFQAVRIIPQVVKGFATKSVEDISWGWLTMGSIGAFLWLAYGILTDDTPIIVGNVVNIASYALIIYQKLTYLS